MAFARGKDVAFLPNIDTLSNAKISHFWQARELLTLGEGESKVTHISRYDEKGDREFFVYRDHSRLGESDWIVGAHFSSDLLSPEIERLQKYGFLSIGVLIFAVVSAAIIGALTSKPIRRLADAARAAHANDLESVPVLPASAIRELDDASASFNEMIGGLKERARIRNLFGKYLPESVAARLLEGDDNLAPQSAGATILFVVLEGFTRWSESLKPPQIAYLLTQYFSPVVSSI